MKKIIVFTLALFLVMNSFATHNMAGDISYTHISGNTYRFSVRTFTNTANTAADRCELVLHIGNDSITIPRVNGPSSLCPSGHDGEMICTNVKYNLYQGVYTFPGNGVYTYSISDQNKSAGICNVTNAVNTLFTLSGELTINPFYGYCESPQYTGAALMQNIVGVISTYNPAVINAQGDSLY